MDFLPHQRHCQPAAGSPAAPDLSRSTVSTLVADLQRRGTRRRARPASSPARASRAARPCCWSSTRPPAPPSASTSTTTRCASRSRTCRAACSRRRPPRTTWTTTLRGALDLAAELVEGRCLTRAAGQGPAARRRHRSRRADRPRQRRAAPVGRAARLGRRRRRGRAGGPSPDARLRRQRRQPGRAGRGDPRRRAQRQLRGLRLDLVGHRRRDHRRRPPLPRARGIAGEIGHVVVDPQGPDLPLRQPRLPGDLGLRAGAVRAPAPLARPPDGAADARAGARRRRRLPARDRRRRPASLAASWRTWCNLFNPEMVVVGGDLGEAGDLLLDPLREAVRRYALPAAAEDVEIVAGTLGDRAELLGALALMQSMSPRRPHWPSRRHMSHPRRRNGPPKGERDVSRRRTFWALAAASAPWLFGIAACGGDDNNDSRRRWRQHRWRSKAGKVAVLLPDSKSSVRWETVDRPLLQKAFEAAGVDATIQNAEGDKSTQQQQAEQAITNGAKVILLVNLDSGSGAAIEANAKSQGVKVIDYDRLTLDRTRRLLRVVRQRRSASSRARASSTASATRRAPRSPSSTARRRTTTRRCSRRATTRSSTRSTIRASSRRSPISPCPTGTTRRR